MVYRLEIKNKCKKINLNPQELLAGGLKIYTSGKSRITTRPISGIS
jgi:hypothetical protein